MIEFLLIICVILIFTIPLRTTEIIDMPTKAEFDAMQDKCEAIIRLSDTLDIFGLTHESMMLTVDEVNEMDTEDILALNEALVASQIG